MKAPKITSVLNNAEGNFIERNRIFLVLNITTIQEDIKEHYLAVGKE